MYNCIFTAHCTELICDKSCPTLVETSYLLERNGISMSSSVFRSPQSDIDNMLSVLDKCENKVGAYVVPSGKSTVDVSELLTYCAICKNWKGSRLHCNVYNLKYSKFVEDTKKSWSLKQDPESLEYSRIWIESSKVLIVSNLDYVNFGDFEAQTLLNILQARQVEGKTTIFVIPPVRTMISSKSSVFFDKLKEILLDAVKVVSK